MFSTPLTCTIGPIGIDFGTSGVKIAQLRRRGERITVSGVADLDITPREMDEMPASAVGDAIRRALREGKFRGRRCVVSLPRCDMSAQSVRMPVLPDDELSEAIQWEAAERFHLDRERIETDYIRMGTIERSGDVREEVLIVAADRERIGQRMEPLFGIGLRPLAIDAPMAALTRFHSMRCRRQSDAAHVRAILEIGGGGSMIGIVRGDQLTLCKMVEIGGAQLDQAVADHLGIELPVACELRRKRLQHAGRGDEEKGNTERDDTRERAIYESVRSHLDHLCKELGLCLRYFGVTFRGHPPDRVVLAGGDGLEPHLGEMVQKACNLPAMVDDPVSPVDALLKTIGTSGHVSARPPQAWAIAAGLSLRGLMRRSSQEPSHAAFAERSAAA